MPRLALGIEYDGSAYAGWQYQSHARTVQGELQQALSRVANHSVDLTAAGRTDAGVHALAMVAHFDSTAMRPLHGWVLGANANASADITVLWAREVPDAFHAQQAVRLDLAHHQAQLVHVGEQHDRGRALVARQAGDQVAHAVAARGDAKLRQLLGKQPADRSLMAAEA